MTNHTDAPRAPDRPLRPGAAALPPPPPAPHEGRTILINWLIGIGGLTLLCLLGNALPF